jgi:hypothetical protein
MRSRRTCCRRKVCPFWLARPPSERFCSDRSRTSGHCTSKGRLGSKLGFVGDALVPASHYIHPEFGFFRPTPRFRRRLRVARSKLRTRRCFVRMTAARHDAGSYRLIGKADLAAIAAWVRPLPAQNNWAAWGTIQLLGQLYSQAFGAVMLTSKAYLQQAEECLQLATASSDVYVKEAPYRTGF